jgi:bifunctional non-homologous end joining protein LigD
MLAQAAPAGDDWLHELSYGGQRLGCLKREARVQIRSADGEDRTQRAPELATAIGALPAKRLLLDGELSGGVYYVFDLLQLDGRDLTTLPLEERKRILCQLVAGASAPLHYVEHVLEEGPRVLREACKLGARGVVSKRRRAGHNPGPSENWLFTACRSAHPRACCTPGSASPSAT